jgi:hypothetical protein
MAVDCRQLAKANYGRLKGRCEACGGQDVRIMPR